MLGNKVFELKWQPKTWNMEAHPRQFCWNLLPLRVQILSI